MADESYDKVYRFVKNNGLSIKDLRKYVDEMGQEMYAQVLIARSNIIVGTIVFYASMFRPAKFLQLMATLDHVHWFEVLSDPHEGNTCLTEPVSWSMCNAVYELLNSIILTHPELYILR